MLRRTRWLHYVAALPALAVHADGHRASRTIVVKLRHKLSELTDVTGNATSDVPVRLRMKDFDFFQTLKKNKSNFEQFLQCLDSAADSCGADIEQCKQLLDKPLVKPMSLDKRAKKRAAKRDAPAQTRRRTRKRRRRSTA